MPDPINDKTTASTPSTDPKLSDTKTPDPVASTDANEDTLSDKDLNMQALRKAKQAADKRVAELEALEKEREETKLKEQGKYKELVEKYKREAEEAKNAYTQKQRQDLIKSELQKSGVDINMLDLILPSIEAKVSFTKEGEAENLTEIVNNLKTSTPVLFLPQKQVASGSTSPASTKSTSAGLSYEEAVEIAGRTDSTEYLARQEEIDELLYPKK